VVPRRTYRGTEGGGQHRKASGHLAPDAEDYEQGPA
jgi:hypothetical protein